MAAGPVGFDLDLTLIDSRAAILSAFAAVSREMDVPIDQAVLESRLGLKLEDELGQWFPPSRVQAAADCYRRIYLRLVHDNTTAMPGAAAAVAAVRAAGQRVVIITAKHPVSVGPSLRAAGLTADELFTHVHGPEKAAVLRELNAAIYVGDSLADIAAGVSAGVLAAGVATGSFTAAELADAGADPVFASLEAFPAWYQALPG
jgi:phosphoglycolate phosphatase